MAILKLIFFILFKTISEKAFPEQFHCCNLLFDTMSNQENTKGFKIALAIRDPKENFNVIVELFLHENCQVWYILKKNSTWDQSCTVVELSMVSTRDDLIKLASSLAINLPNVMNCHYSYWSGDHLREGGIYRGPDGFVVVQPTFPQQLPSNKCDISSETLTELQKEIARLIVVKKHSIASRRLVLETKN